MRAALVGFLLATAALIFASFAGAQGPAANELGRVMILEYHKIDYPEERWTRTPENFRRDLETLYAKGYRLQSLTGLVEGRITVPAGTTPVVLTFDDSSAGQFRYLDRNGSLEIDPKSGVGVLEAFIREKPDFGRAATFFVLPGGQGTEQPVQSAGARGAQAPLARRAGLRDRQPHPVARQPRQVRRDHGARAAGRGPGLGAAARAPVPACAPWRFRTASIRRRSAGPSAAPPRGRPIVTRRS